MRFYFGLVREDTGVRYVVTGEATPTLKDVAELSSSDVISESCDWGPDASEESLYTLSLTLLSHALSSGDLVLVGKFAREVLAKMDTGKRWLLSDDDIRKWAETKVTVQ